MGSANDPSLSPMPSRPWFDRLGLSGKLLAFGAVAGIVVAFLPLVSVSFDMNFLKGNRTAMVVEDWRGKVCLATYLGALVLAFVLYPPHGLSQKALCWVGVVAGLVVTVLAVWLLFLAIDAATDNLMGLGKIRASVGVGAVLNVVAAGVVTAGGFLKAREEKLI